MSREFCRMTGTQRQEVVGFWGVGGSDQALHRVHLSRWIGLELGWRGGLSWQGPSMSKGMEGADWVWVCLEQSGERRGRGR